MTWRINDQRGSGWMDNSIYIASKDGNIAKLYNDFGDADDNAALIIHAVNNIKRVEREREELAEALRFYADRDNYFGKTTPMGPGTMTVYEINGDCGHKAREALTKIRNSGEV